MITKNLLAHQYNIILTQSCKQSKVHIYILLQASNTEYGKAAVKVGPRQLVVFEEDKITLDLTEDEVLLANGWSITPLTDLEVRLYMICNYIVHECQF